MNPLTVFIVALATGCTGLVVGWSCALYVSRAIEAENAEMRAGLRFVRNTIGMTIGFRPLVQYVDRLLGDEAA